jgi:hypothetical protein
MADGVEVKNHDGRYLISMDGRYAALQRGGAYLGLLREGPRDEGPETSYGRIPAGGSSSGPIGGP